jgi:hypothetical protein
MEGYKMLWNASLNGVTLAAAAEDDAVCNPNKKLSTEDCYDALNDVYVNPDRPVVIPTKNAKRDTGMEVAVSLPASVARLIFSHC